MKNLRITLKIASSLDGRIALADGTSQWITSSASRARGHQMRAENDAIMVGIGTALADDPLLTARTVPLPAKQPVRIVADSNARLPTASRLASSTDLGRVVAVTAGQGSDALAAAGVDIWRCGNGVRMDAGEFVRRAEAEGLRTLLIEGGSTLAASFMRAGLVDEIAWFRAPILIGGDGLPALGALGLSDLKSAARWRPVATERIGDDVLDTYVRSEQ
ncbi:riboflavin biosynthesis protein RibD C-terminal domain protein [Hyphomonas neptunium ATCC 15444]|uniref:Riboflavin biosynthesis protein RibD C-terminal domain protein n=2 Tax=Hyphomonas TaxID=85 RepID=Q0C0I7_HYPNA|nr:MULTISPECIES: RibD family protein [Hyphomonas]ABI76595.1 riboflavin biosynthesis protein RibD C-terminal domain protein [Hyphomonas neptunium ATCC 15444]KCZ87548.1 riboflavin biosynthesis protein RibD domain-containing protein [Hyphomonas hirschiana VP5]